MRPDFAGHPVAIVLFFCTLGVWTVIEIRQARCQGWPRLASDVSHLVPKSPAGQSHARPDRNPTRDSLNGGSGTGLLHSARRAQQAMSH
jgi:hypothetical protein